MFLVGLIVLCGIVYLAIWVIEQFINPIPPKVKQGVWVIVLLLALIALLTALLGGGVHAKSIPFDDDSERVTPEHPNNPQHPSRVDPLSPVPPAPPSICRGC
jgi:hypothetical protein